jgi:hypothetical protein
VRIQSFHSQNDAFLMPASPWSRRSPSHLWPGAQNQGSITPCVVLTTPSTWPGAVVEAGPGAPPPVSSTSIPATGSPLVGMVEVALAVGGAAEELGGTTGGAARDVLSMRNWRATLLAIMANPERGGSELSVTLPPSPGPEGLLLVMARLPVGPALIATSTRG